jgi:hypothetical protein
MLLRTCQLGSPQQFIMSPKTKFLVGLGVALAIFVAFLLVDTTVASALALELAAFSAFWDSYMLALVFPIVVIVKVLWNPSAERAVTPVTRRFLHTGVFIVIGVVVVGVVAFANYYIIVPGAYRAFVAAAYGQGVGPGLDVLIQIGLILAAPVICFAIASPSGFSRSVDSLRRLFD